MSRKNSREEKARRRLENAWKLDRYSPIPTPDEYISHIGFVPNEPFFYNSAVASIINGQQFAFRTKNQLVDYVLIEYFKNIDTNDTALELPNGASVEGSSDAQFNKWWKRYSCGARPRIF